MLTRSHIDSIVEWTNKWLMKLNIEKCKVMHFGKHNTKHIYTMDSYTTNTPIPLATSEVERDLGIQLTVNLKVSHQCKTAANRANFQLSVLKSNFISCLTMEKTLCHIHTSPSRIRSWCLESMSVSRYYHSRKSSGTSNKSLSLSPK